MTARLSTGKFSYLIYRLVGMKSRIIALCLMSLFSFPLFSVGLDLTAYAELIKRRGPVPPETYADLEARSIMINTIGMILIIAACVLLFVLFLQGLFTAKESMRHLWNRKYTDMDMSLPVSADTRFFGGIVSGFGIYIIPQLIAAGIALLLLIPAEGMIAETRQYMTANSADVGSFYDFYRNIIGYLLCANVMQYFFSLMIISFCGRKLTANIVPFIFNLGIPCAIFFLSVITGVNCYGVDTGELMYGPLWDCTPIGIILSSFTLYSSQYGGLYRDLSWLRAILYSLAFGTAAYFMIKYRREERAGSAFVYKPGRYATEFVIMLASASVIYLASLHDSSIEFGLHGVAGLIYNLLNVPTPILVTTWVIVNIFIFVIIELVSREKLKKPKRLALAAARFAVSAGVSFLICFGFMNSDGFGAAAYIPEVSEISSIGFITYGPDMAYIEHYAERKDENAKQMITDLHRRIVTERPDDSENRYNEYQYVNITYDLKSGITVSRRYSLPTEYTLDCMKTWFEIGAFAESYTDRFPSAEALDGMVVKIVDHGTQRGEDGWKTTDITCEEFLTALRHDVEKTTYEDIFRHNGTDYIEMCLTPENSLRSLYVFTIWDTFEETHRLLKEHNFDMYVSRNQNAVRYYMYKATSVGNYQTGEKLIQIVDNYGYPGTTEERHEFHILDETTAKELMSKSAVMTAYAESRDIYVIVPSYEFIDDQGNITYMAGSSAYKYYVTEPNCDEAAGIYANAPAVSSGELAKYLPSYNYDNFEGAYNYDGEVWDNEILYL